MKYFLFLFLGLSSIHAGGLDREIYNGLSGSDLDTLKNSHNFLLKPDHSDIISDYQSPSNYGNKFGALIRGYITVPETADYTFYLSSDNYGELYLSTDVSESPNKQYDVSD